MTVERPYRRTTTITLRECAELGAIFSPMGEGDASRLTQAIATLLLSAGFCITQDPVTHGYDVTMRPFGTGFGYTFVAILSESHCAIHTYPEEQYGVTVEVEFNLCYLNCDHSEKIEEARLRLIDLFRPRCVEEVEHSRKRYFTPIAASVVAA